MLNARGADVDFNNMTHDALTVNFPLHRNTQAMKMEIYFVEQKHYNCRRTCSQWDNDWKDILPKAPEKPSDETGVWRLVDDASDWRDISENVAKIPRLRQRRYCYQVEKKIDKKCYRADVKKLLSFYKQNEERRNMIKPNKRTCPFWEEKTAKVMVDKSVQTDDEGNHELFVVMI